MNDTIAFCPDEGFGSASEGTVLKGATFSSNSGFNMVGTFSPDAESIGISDGLSNDLNIADTANVEAALSQIHAAKAVDDFTHIPLAVCETAADVDAKEIVIPGWTYEKHPLIAVQFKHGITPILNITLSVNGGVSAFITTSLNPVLKIHYFNVPAGTILILSNTAEGGVWKIINMPGKASESMYGLVQIAENPGSEPNGTYDGSAASPNYVKNIALCEHDFALTYPINALVMQDGAIYKSLQNNNESHPVTDSVWWVQY